MVSIITSSIMLLLHGWFDLRQAWGWLDNYLGEWRGWQQGRVRLKGWDAAMQTWPTDPAQTLIPDLWQRNGEAYQLQQSVDVPTDGKKTALSSEKPEVGRGLDAWILYLHPPPRVQTQHETSTAMEKRTVTQQKTEKTDVPPQWYIPHTHIITAAASEGVAEEISHLLLLFVLLNVFVRRLSLCLRKTTGVI